MKNKKNHFARGLRTGASIITLSLVASFALAQSPSSDEAVDEIEVTGIRNALESSMNIKRNAKGIVDSISAEDIGKFPDSNLAESLQRITGLSIDRNRASGEGRHVTARGFGADFNLVTFNGRNMPTSTLGDFAQAPSTRSYDFGNLASEAVSRVDVYKTSKANTASGGIGSTIDIRTTRPLEVPGFNASVGLKQVDDQSQDGSPHNEVSAIIYNTWLDDRIGLAVTAIDTSLNHTVASFRHQWSGFEEFGSEITTPANDELGLPGGDVVTGVSNGTLLSTLNGSTGYYIDDLEQERKNYQLTFQARPMNFLTLTVDYTNSQLRHEVNSRSLSIHHADGANSFYGLTTEYGAGNPATPISLEFINPQGGFQSREGGATERGIDALSNNIGFSNNLTEVDTYGFNAEWEVNSRLILEFDHHNSTSESKPLSPYGSNAFINSDAMVHDTTFIDYTTEIPVIELRELNPDQVRINTVDGEYDTLARNSRFFTGAGNTRAYMENEIEQSQINGSFDLIGTDFETYIDDIKFGVSVLDNRVTSSWGEWLAPNWNGLPTPNWGGWPYYAGANPADLFETTEPLRPYFSGLSGADQIFPEIINMPYEKWFAAYQTLWNRANADAGGNAPYAAICRNNKVSGCREIPYSTDRSLTEDTLAAYIQASKEFQIQGRDASLTLGLRFEETEVTSLNLTPLYVGTQWTGADVVNALRADGAARITRTASEYDYLLPSIDFDVDIRDDVKLRASYNQTIARPTYDKLAGGVTINSNIAGYSKQNPGGFSGGAFEGDPTLDPYEATNIDLSAEWYYGDISYMSVGYFTKEVTNFIGNASRQAPIAGINGNIKHVGFLANGNNSGAAHGTNTLGNEADYEDVIFNISFPEQTGDEETVDGLELAIQHDFGDYNPFPIDLTGFGIIANMTVVDSDASYNDRLPNSEDDRQFAIIGISDSHNLSVYYERFGVSARVAYNWRDRFLNFSGASSGYTEEAEQVDANISYTIPDTNVTLSYDGINLTEEGSHTFERNNPAYTTWRNAGHAKHYVGLRWKY